MNKHFFTLMLLVGLSFFIGCQPSESEAVRRLATTVASVSETAVKEQAQLNQKVSEATDTLVRAGSEGRIAMIKAHDQLQIKLQSQRAAMIETHDQLQHKLESERASLDDRRKNLDLLKGQIEQDRRRAPIIAESIQSVGGIIACLCPLFLAAYVLYSMNKTIEGDQEKIVNQFLMNELTSDSPVLLPAVSASSRLEDQHHQHFLATSDPQLDDEPPF